MRVLVLSFYYAPDLSAGSFRTTAFVSALRELLPSGAHVDVITTLPNRYRSFTSEAPALEQHAGLCIRRIALPSHSSDVAGQAAAFVAFARSVLRDLRGRKYDLVYGTSSRLMTAVLAAVCARRAGSRLYLDIRDLFSDTIGDVFPSSYAWLLKALFSRVEAWAIRSADKVNLVSRGFEDYFRRRYPEKPLSFVTNGIDPEFLADSRAGQAHEFHVAASDRPAIRVVYAGNIGEGQGLHNILPRLALRLGDRVEFRVIGDGGRRQQLASALAASGCRNVDLVPPVTRSQLLREYGAADVLFMHLNDHEAFKKVLPSKVFEYAALGKPIWAGVSGYAAEFVHREIENAAVFAPCDDAAAERCLGELHMVDTPRPGFVERYRREVLMRKLASDVLGLVPVSA